MGNLVKYILFSILTVVAWLVADYYMPESWIDHGAYWGLGFFTLITAISLWVGLNGLQKSDVKFVTHVNGAITIKLLGAMIFLIVFLLNFTENKLEFVVNFFIQYLLFTVFEISALLTTLRPQKKS